MTNTSPMEVRYKWSFLVNSTQPVAVYHPRPKPPVYEPSMSDVAVSQGYHSFSPLNEVHGVALMSVVDWSAGVVDRGRREW